MKDRDRQRLNGNRLDEGVPVATKRPRAIVGGWWLVVLLIVLLVSDSDGVLFWKTGDPDHNTSAPSADLEGSGWSLQGKWGSYSAAPIFFLSKLKTFEIN